MSKWQIEERKFRLRNQNTDKAFLRWTSLKRRYVLLMAQIILEGGKGINQTAIQTSIQTHTLEIEVTSGKVVFDSCHSLCLPKQCLLISRCPPLFHHLNYSSYNCCLKLS